MSKRSKRVQLEEAVCQGQQRAREHPESVRWPPNEDDRYQHGPLALHQQHSAAKHDQARADAQLNGGVKNTDSALTQTSITVAVFRSVTTLQLSVAHG